MWFLRLLSALSFITKYLCCYYSAKDTLLDATEQSNMQRHDPYLILFMVSLLGRISKLLS
jgi:hypothetical protein